MFNVLANPTFTRPVEVSIPDGDGHKKESLIATFSALSDSQTEEFNLSDPDGVKAFLRAAIVSLDDLGDDQGNPVPFSPEILENLIGRPYVRISLLRVYTRAQIEGLAGN